MTTEFDDTTLPLSTPIVLPAAGSQCPTEAMAATCDVAGADTQRVADPEKLDVWGTHFASLTMQDTLTLADTIVQHRRPEYFVTANLNYLMLCEQHPRLDEVNRDAKAVLADGQPIVLRSRLASKALPERVAGSDLIVELARLSAGRGYRVYFLGGAPQVARSAADELRRRFPDLQVAGCYSPPFRSLTAAEHDEMLGRIRDADTDILLVAFGQPKGELWVADNFRDLRVPLSIQLGASFDFLAGTAKRAPKPWRRCGCEWLYRALSDPRRLVPRYAGNARFLGRLLLRDAMNSGMAALWRGIGRT